MCPITHFSYIALAAALVASFIFGYVWYGPLFGKTWAQLMGMNIENCKDKKPPLSSMLLTLLGTAFTTFAVAYLLSISKPFCNFSFAAIVWLGFYVPLLFSTIAWEGKPWKLFALNAAFYFLNIELITSILIYLR